jgi:hypothetical protein
LNFHHLSPLKVVPDGMIINGCILQGINHFTELRIVLNDLVESFFSEVVGSSASVPVIITDSTGTLVIESGNLDEE